MIHRIGDQREGPRPQRNTTAKTTTTTEMANEAERIMSSDRRGTPQLEYVGSGRNAAQTCPYQLVRFQLKKSNWYFIAIKKS